MCRLSYSPDLPGFTRYFYCRSSFGFADVTLSGDDGFQQVNSVRSNLLLQRRRTPLFDVDVWSTSRMSL